MEFLNIEVQNSLETKQQSSIQTKTFNMVCEKFKFETESCKPEELIPKKKNRRKQAKKKKIKLSELCTNVEDDGAQDVCD